MASNLTKYTVQEVLNRESNFEYYAAVYDDSVNLSSATELGGEGASASALAFPTAYGAANIFAAYDQNERAFEYTKVIIESDQALYIQLGKSGYRYDSTGDGTLNFRSDDFGSIIYVPAANLPITLTNYNITNLKIKMGGSGTLGIQAWR